jgi:hypothetical protein
MTKCGKFSFRVKLNFHGGESSILPRENRVMGETEFS